MKPMPYRPAPRLSRSGLVLHDEVTAADFPHTLLRYRNDRAASSVGLDGLSDAEWTAHFGRFQPLPDNQPVPLALRYHGHQFGQYNPDLGDGRGFLFAQVLDEHDRLLDLGTKGSGTTPYSRRGDGRLTLKGGVREVLATAMLEALGVPTSKSFSLIETGEQLIRGDEPSPTRSSVLVRLSHSHIRFGTFQRLAFHGDTETMTQLIDFVIANYYPDARGASGLFDAVVTASARLAACWMAAGFVHGVLNTDNMNITGESFDYGPYRFLPRYDPEFTAAYFDHSGLYAYGRQPDVVLWNLNQLGRCFSLITDSAPLIDSLKTYAACYQTELDAAICRRLNLRPRGDDRPLSDAVFAVLSERSEDGSFEALFYDFFGGVKRGPRDYEGPACDRFTAILKDYQTADPTALDHPRLQQPDPETLLIDEIEAIWAPIAQSDDWSSFYAKLDAIEQYRQALSLAPFMDS